ncbi:RHS repeat-associated core domain-containing protein [Nafulsella turpanensis]|uniref:RHS repeat-associated core domain-containing protein n=1 Tax=Nafulsella turpanensis TaxID=1265690 RepID=UPI00034B6A7C|nr:RHS repeat-associated core domain-containing protein [Nafulsella turpanensis]
MDYNTVGGITAKQQTHERKGGEENEWKEQKKTTYSQSYEYGQEQPNAPTHIGKQAYSYDKNGNQTGWTHDVSGQRRQILWDEENRIRTIYDNGAAFHYTYDASGTRVIKGRSSGQAAYVNNEHKGGSGNMGNYTVYVNPYIVLKSGGYTKHFYIEGQRIVSKLGGGMADASKGQKAGGDKVNYPDKQEQSREGIVRNLKFLGHDGAILTAGKSGKIPPGQIIGEGESGGNGNGGGKGGKEGEHFQYYYHPDHLGSSSYITDASGEVYQHLEYFAFGETFVEEHSNTHRTPYLYNGKELDEETGLYYYGARFYDPQTSVWLAVDPMAEKFAGWNAYNYTLNNPVRLTDPDGKAPLDIIIKGQNNSSITIKTDLIDVAVDASSFGADFGGNHTLEGRAIVQTGLDIVGAVDPTGIADVINGGMYFENGDYGDALISGFGLIPYAGDAAKIPRIAKGLDRISDAIKMSKLRKSAAIGQEAHRQIQKGLRKQGANTEVPMTLKDGTNVRKDAVRPDGTTVIIKPDTPSGRRSAAKRESLMQKNGHSTETIFYNPQSPNYQPGSPTYLGPKNKLE